MNGSTWFLGIIIFILVILAIVFLILWLVNRSKVHAQNSQLSIKDLQFCLENTTTVNATWSGTGNPGNQVTLYADTKTINFNASGKPEDNANIKTSETVSASSKKVSLSGLTPNTKYFLAVTIINPKLTGFNSEPGQIYTGLIPEGSFVIQEINTPGAISLDVNNDTTVTYDKSVNKSEVNDIWTYDPKNFTISTRGVGANSNTVPTLFNNNGVLAAEDLSTLEKNSNFNSIAQWEYDKCNRWCLKSNPNLCMHLERPVEASSSIKLVENSKIQWINLELLEDVNRIPRSSSNTSECTDSYKCSSDYTDSYKKHLSESSYKKHSSDCSDSSYKKHSSDSSYKKKSSDSIQKYSLYSSEPYYKKNLKKSFSTSELSSY
jgi:hypothetical protein